MSLFRHYQSRYDQSRPEELTLEEYLNLCKRDPAAYATAPERMLHFAG